MTTTTEAPTSRVPAPVSEQQLEYLRETAPYFAITEKHQIIPDYEELADHTGLHPWQVRRLTKDIKPLTEQQKEEITPLAIDLLRLQSEKPELSIKQLAALYNLPEGFVRGTLHQVHALAPDSFRLIREWNGGKVNRIPRVLRRTMQEMYKGQWRGAPGKKFSTAQIAEWLLKEHGILVTPFAVRNLLPRIGTPLRDREEGTLLAVNKLSPIEEKWIVHCYQSSDQMSIPLVRSAFQGKFKKDLSNATILRVLEQYNIPIRGARRQMTVRERDKRLSRLRAEARAKERSKAQ